jgi:hypothetical protein
MMNESQAPFGAWLWMAALSAAIAAPAFAFDDPEDLPEGPGREEGLLQLHRLPQLSGGRPAGDEPTHVG